MAIQRTTEVAITLPGAMNSLASSATAAVQSSEVTSGTTNNVVDIVASWAIAIGTISASSTTRVDVYVWGTTDSAGYPGGSATAEVITGTAGTITLSSNGVAGLKYLKTVLAHTSGITIRSEASIVNALGFVPRRWGLVFVNQTGASLAASGHSAEYVEVYYT